MRFITIGACLGLAVAAFSLQDKKPPVLRISLLVFDGCPNSPKMKVNLQSAMRALHLSGIEVVDIFKLPRGDLRRGYGAPTVLVNGKDLFGRPIPKDGAVSCRIYGGGVPLADEIERKLKALIRR